MKTLVIIPAYNEADSICRVVQNLKEQCPDVDYLVVNDCSTDKTLEVLESNKLCYINLPTNLGIGGGVQSGYRYARDNGYDIAIQMDGDGQHDPAFLSALIEPIENNEADMVIGSRFLEEGGFQSSFMRRVGIHFLSFLIKVLTGKKVYDVTSGFRACNKETIQLFAQDYAQDYPEPDAIVSCVLNGYRVGEVSVDMIERKEGKSSINPFNSVYYMIKVSISLIVSRIVTKKRK